jgi:hypothetical protein
MSDDTEARLSALDDVYGHRTWLAYFERAEAAIRDRMEVGDDVLLIRTVANYWQPQDGDGVSWDRYQQEQAALRELADRIEASIRERMEASDDAT